MSYVYKAPFGHGAKYLANVNGLVDSLVGGWEVSGAAYAYSGLPFTVIDTASASAINSYKTGEFGGSFIANQVNPAVKVQNICGYGLQVCLTKANFSAATGLESNQSRNQYRGPMYFSTDFAAAKSIPLHWEDGRLSVSAQAFNVLNHLNFGRPTGALNSSSFAKITTVINPTGVLTGINGDDSPRIVQLKAKVVF